MCVSVLVPGGKSLECKGEVGGKPAISCRHAWRVWLKQSDSSWQKSLWPAVQVLLICASLKTTSQTGCFDQLRFPERESSSFPFPHFPKQPEEEFSWSDPSDVSLHPLPPPRPPPGCSGPPDAVNLPGVTGQRSKNTEGHPAGLHQGESLVGWIDWHTLQFLLRPKWGCLMSENKTCGAFRRVSWI